MEKSIGIYEEIVGQIKAGELGFEDVDDLYDNLDTFGLNIYEFSKILLELFDHTAKKALADGYLDDIERLELVEISAEIKKNIPNLKLNKNYMANIKKDINLLQQKYLSKSHDNVLKIKENINEPNQQKQEVK